MQQWAWRFLPVLALATGFAPTALAAAHSADAGDIVRLTDPDASVRALARNHLSDCTDRLSGPLAEALRSDDPELRQQTAQLLLNRRWTEPGDSDMVHQLMANYANLETEARCDQIDLLLGLPQEAGRPAVIRILRFDPNATVRWAAMTALRPHKPIAPADAAAFSGQLLSAGESPAEFDNRPLQALAAWLLHEVDPLRAKQLLQPVIDAEANDPTAVRGELDVVLLWMIDQATAAGDTPRALALLRQQARQQPWDPRIIPQSVFSILSLHADHGPCDGWKEDINAASGYWNRPEAFYCLARWADRQGMRWLSSTVDAVSIVASGVSPEAHEEVGSFLLTQDWVDAAEREFIAAKWLSGGTSVNAWLDLSHVADKRDDDLGVATNLQEALQRVAGQQLHTTSRYGDVAPWPEKAAWAEVHFRFLRAAMRANDQAAIDLHLKKLLELDKSDSVLADNSEIAADLVPALRKLGRNEEADRCFAAAFKTMRDAVTAAPNDAQSLNNLAWLCACAGEHLKEAQGWADRAIAAAPATAAYVDTAAEVSFRAGHAGAAAELEAKALAMSPEDVFMQHQLAMFRQAATTRP